MCAHEHTGLVPVLGQKLKAAGRGMAMVRWCDKSELAPDRLVDLAVMMSDTVLYVVTLCPLPLKMQF
jgi:hypothetical protein